MIKINQISKLVFKIDNIRLNRVLNILKTQVPDYFFIKPSSSSGKYHPQDEFCTGGLVLHTLRVIEVADLLCDVHDITGERRQDILEACIFHDSIKYGNPDQNNVKTVKEHPVLPAFYLDISTKVDSLIRTHSGKFYDFVSDEWDNGTLDQIIVHEADFIASRRNVDISVDQL